MNYIQVIKALYDLEYTETIKMKEKHLNLKDNFIIIKLEDDTIMHLHHGNDKNNIHNIFISYNINATGQIESLEVNRLKQELFNMEMKEIINENKI